MTCKWLITILRTKPEKNAPFQLAPATRWAPFFVINPTKTVPFMVSAPLRGRALFHFLSLCHLLVRDVVCLGWGGWGGGW